MSEPTTSRPAQPPAGPQGKKPAGKKLLGLPVPVVIVGGVAGATLLVIWWRGRSKKATPSTTSSTSSTSAGTDYSNQLAELQSEIDELMADQGQGGSTTHPTTPTKQKPFRPVTGTRTTHITDSGATLTWAGLESATSYRLTVQHNGEDIHNNTQNGRSFQLTGLKPGQGYVWKVAGVNEAGQGPYSVPVTFRTKTAAEKGGTLPGGLNPGGQNVPGTGGGTFNPGGGNKGAG